MKIIWNWFLTFQFEFFKIIYNLLMWAKKGYEHNMSTGLCQRMACKYNLYALTHSSIYLGMLEQK